MENAVANRYFEWMCRCVRDKEHNNYTKLLHQLNDIEFTYTLPMDGNRYEDGIDLRYRFGYDCNYDESVIAYYLDVHPCSVLEMMVALALRLEEHIMDDPDIGNRTSVWFWEMIFSLGLSDMSDDNYNELKISATIQQFLDREYSKDGRGGLFTIKGIQKDMRDAEIWYQACWYLNGVLHI